MTTATSDNDQQHDFTIPLVGFPPPGRLLCSRCAAQSMYRGPCVPLPPVELAAALKSQHDWLEKELADGRGAAPSIVPHAVHDPDCILSVTSTGPGLLSLVGDNDPQLMRAALCCVVGFIIGGSVGGVPFSPAEQVAAGELLNRLNGVYLGPSTAKKAEVC